MAAESNTSFHRGNSLSSGLHRHAISFQPGAIHSSSDVIPIGNYYAGNSINGNLMFCDNSRIISSGSPTASGAGNSSGSLLLDSVPGLKHEAGLAVEWTEQEQYLLENGLVQYKDEPKIMRYIKIAANLPEKTVRDVALRCLWMARKQVKPDDWRRKGPYRKDKFAESSSKSNLPSTSIPNVAPYSFQRNQMDQNQRLKCQVLSSKANQLLEQNYQALNQIDNNIVQVCSQIDNNMTCLKDIGGSVFNMGNTGIKSECSQLQDNIELFCRARDNINNINVILNNMQQLSGKMSQMRDLPVSIDQDCVNRILPRTTL